MRTHGKDATYQTGCRCDACRRANAKYTLERRRASPPLTVDDPRHGTANGYTNLGCRCDACRTANADEHHRYMQAYPEQRAKHALRDRVRRGRAA